MVLKNWRWYTLILLAPGFLLAEVIEWALALSFGWRGVSAKVRANFWVVTHLREIVKLHVKTQAERRVSDAATLRERIFQLEPKTVTGGPVGHAAVAVCTTLFLLNYRVVRLIYRILSF